MERPMTEWNDDRLDELNERMKDGFATVDKRFVRLEGEMKEGFARVDERLEHVASRTEVAKLREETSAGLNRINDRIDQIHHAVWVAAATVIGTLLANTIWG